jgi:peptidoglycan/LPS O-acetylase OafA/YrhL
MQRIDRHGWYTIAVWIGLVLSGVYVLLMPEDASVASLPDWFDNLLGLAMVASAGLCLAGVVTRDWRRAYTLEIVGLGGVVVVLGVLAIATNVPLWAQFTLQGGLGAVIQIGSLRAMAGLWMALRTP